MKRSDLSPEALEKRRARDRVYARTHRGVMNAAQKRWREKHPERELARHQEQYVKMRQTRYWLRLLSQAKKRAVKKGLAFDLTKEWALDRWTGKCEETGIVFHTGNDRHPFSPSIDRRDNSQGYTQENARFVCWGFNAAKCCGTDADVLAIARALVSRSAA